MTKELWINLPVKDINRSTAFFEKIGFPAKKDSPGFSLVSAPLIIGAKNIVVMLFEESAFKGATQANVSDTGKGTEVMFSFDVESRAEVDEIAKKVEAAGGIVFGQPSVVQGWMYGCGFTDLDGHRWNVLYMSK